MSKLKYTGPRAEKLVLADGLTLTSPADLEGSRYEQLLPHHPQLASYYELVERPKAKKGRKQDDDEDE